MAHAIRDVRQKEFAEDMSEKFQSAANAAMEKAENIVKKIPGVIKEHPLQTLLVGLGLGFTIGMVIYQVRKSHV